MKRSGMVLLIAGIFSMMAAPGYADAETEQQKQQQEQMQKLNDMVVKEKYGTQGVEQTPTKTVIDVQTALPSLFPTASSTYSKAMPSSISGVNPTSILALTPSTCAVSTPNGLSPP